MQKMNRYVWIAMTLPALLLCSCGKQKAETVQNKQATTEETSSKVDLRVHTNMESYINNHVYGPDSGMHCPYFTLPPKLVSGTTLDWDGKKYTIELEYKGSELQTDRYQVSLIFDGKTVLDRQVTYAGADIELWRDDKVRIGLRPWDGKKHTIEGK